LILYFSIIIKLFYLADVYEAVYPYQATDPADLSFQVGERIIVLKRDGAWWTGKIGNRTGTFPNNYVQKIETVNFSDNKNFLIFLLNVFSHYKKQRLQ
jgi:hypothetical protein